MHHRSRLIRFLRAIPAALFAAAFLLYEEAEAGCLILLAVLAHEGGHLLAFSLLGEPLPLFSVATGGFRLLARRPLSYRREALVAAAGPGADLLIALLFLAISFLFPPILGYCRFCFWIFLVTGALNLLPLGDLDGGRIVRCFLAEHLSDRMAEEIAKSVSILTAGVGVFFSLAVLWLSGACFYASFFFLFFLLSIP